MTLYLMTYRSRWRCTAGRSPSTIRFNTVPSSSTYVRSLVRSAVTRGVILSPQSHKCSH